MNMKLYEIDDRIKKIIETGSFVDENTGELLDNNDLDQLEIDFAKKVDNILCIIKEKNCLLTSLEEQKKNFEQRIKSEKSQIESLKSYLLHHTNGKEFSSARAELKWTTSEQISITIEKNVPSKFIKTTKTINKAELKKAVKAGLTIEGVEIVKKENAQIK